MTLLVGDERVLLDLCQRHAPASGQRVALVDVDVQQIVLHVLEKDVPPVARLDDGAAAVAGKEQHPTSERLVSTSCST